MDDLTLLFATLAMIVPIVFSLVLLIQNLRLHKKIDVEDARAIIAELRPLVQQTKTPLDNVALDFADDLLDELDPETVTITE